MKVDKWHAVEVLRLYEFAHILHKLLPVLDVLDTDLQGYVFDVSSSDRCADVDVRMQRLLLNAGKYTASVIVLSEDNRVLCRHDRAFEITVVAACASGASMILPALWDSKPQATRSSTEKED